MAKLQTIKRNDSRLYIHPDTGEKLPGVTSILNMLPKPYLKFWASKLVAEHAVENFGALANLVVTDKAGAIDWLKRAPQRSTSGSADTGTAVHDYFELYARDKAPKHVHPDVKPFARHIAEFHDRYQPRYLCIEEAVLSNEHKYAGSFDAIAEIEGEIVMLDAKTTKSGVHAEVALQLSAYSYADELHTQDGEIVAVPSIDAGAVLHLRPEGWKLVPARVDREVFDAFLTLRKVFDWVGGMEKTVLGDPVFDSTADASTGSKRRA